MFFKKLEADVWSKEKSLTHNQKINKIIGQVNDVAFERLYPNIPNMQIKFGVSAGEAKKIIDEEVSRFLAYLRQYM